MEVPKKLKIELLYDSTIPFLGTYPEKTIVQNDTCTPMFIAALFTITRTWKQPKGPSAEEWVKKMWYMYTQWDTTQPCKEQNHVRAEMWRNPKTVTQREYSKS